MVQMSEQAPLQTFYDAVGGHATFVALVKRFYEGVASDPPLRACIPSPILLRPKSGFGCSWSSTGEVRPPTASNVGIPGCGCVTLPLR